MLSVVAKETQLSSAEKEQSSGSTHIHTPAFQDTFWIQYANTLNMIVCENVYTDNLLLLVLFPGANLRQDSTGGY